MTTVKMYKTGSIWNYTTEYPGRGSMTCCNRGTQREALNRALVAVPPGTEYRLIIERKDRGTFTR